MVNIIDYLTETIGKVEVVDTKKIGVEVSSEEMLNRLKINDIAIMSGDNADEKLIGIITKVNKKRIDIDDTEENEEQFSANTCNIILVGTFYIKLGAKKRNILTRI